jgi:hypothetical protein
VGGGGDLPSGRSRSRDGASPAKAIWKRSVPRLGILNSLVQSLQNRPNSLSLDLPDEEVVPGLEAKVAIFRIVDEVFHVQRL